MLDNFLYNVNITYVWLRRRNTRRRESMKRNIETWRQGVVEVIFICNKGWKGGNKQIISHMTVTESVITILIK